MTHTRTAAPILAILCVAGCSQPPPTPARTEAAAATRPAATAPHSTVGFRDAFSVAKSALGPSGTGAYFDLTPGSVSRFRNDEDGVTLTVTVLDQTRTIDGVTTRIIEEREEKNGVPVEVSRNFFAVDPATGDVY